MFLRRLLCFWIIVSFLSTLIIPIPKASASLVLPEPGTMVSLSPVYEPVLIKGLKVHPENPFKFDFIVDTGDDLSLRGQNSSVIASSSSSVIASEAKQSLKEQSTRLIKYFLASLTIPEKNLWVNLSPYEKDRMIASDLGQTQMGQDMLAQDYILKQLTASLIYPEKNLGKSFWDKVYTKAQELYGTTQLPVNTFNKVWIVADKADVFERGNIAYIVGAHLKVMLEEDYMALEKHVSSRGGEAAVAISKRTANVQEIASSLKSAPRNDTHALASQIIKTIILPAIEQEVNQGKNFAPLRQMFYSMILASWYKMALKDAFLNQIYSNQSKVRGMESPGVIARSKATKQSLQDSAKTEVDQIFQQYLKAYKKGVFNYIREDINATTKQPMPRKYFSGGEQVWGELDHAQIVQSIPEGTVFPDHAVMAQVTVFPGLKPIDKAQLMLTDLGVEYHRYLDQRKEEIRTYIQERNQQYVLQREPTDKAFLKQASDFITSLLDQRYQIAQQLMDGYDKKVSGKRALQVNQMLAEKIKRFRLELQASNSFERQMWEHHGLTATSLLPSGAVKIINTLYKRAAEDGVIRSGDIVEGIEVASSFLDSVGVALSRLESKLKESQESLQPEQIKQQLTHYIELYSYYYLFMLSLRTGEHPTADFNILQKRFLDRLNNDTQGTGDILFKEATSLLIPATSSEVPEVPEVPGGGEYGGPKSLAAYRRMILKMHLLDDYRQKVNWMLKIVKVNASHLIFQQHHLIKDHGGNLMDKLQSLRRINMLDYYLISQGLPVLLEQYEELLRKRQTDKIKNLRKEIAEAVLLAIYSDPEVFLEPGGQQQIYTYFQKYLPQSENVPMEYYRALLEACALPLSEDMGSLNPTHYRYSPLSDVYLYADDIVAGMMLDAIFWIEGRKNQGEYDSLKRIPFEASLSSSNDPYVKERFPSNNFDRRLHIDKEKLDFEGVIERVRSYKNNAAMNSQTAKASQAMTTEIVGKTKLRFLQDNEHSAAFDISTSSEVKSGHGKHIVVERVFDDNGTQTGWKFLQNNEPIQPDSKGHIKIGDLLIEHDKGDWFHAMPLKGSFFITSTVSAKSETVTITNDGVSEAGKAEASTNQTGSSDVENAIIQQISSMIQKVGGMDRLSKMKRKNIKEYLEKRFKDDQIKVRFADPSNAPISVRKVYFIKTFLNSGEPQDISLVNDSPKHVESNIKNGWRKYILINAGRRRYSFFIGSSYMAPMLTKFQAAPNAAMNSQGIGIAGTMGSRIQDNIQEANPPMVAEALDKLSAIAGKFEATPDVSAQIQKAIESARRDYLSVAPEEFEKQAGWLATVFNTFFFTRNGDRVLLSPEQRLTLSIIRTLKAASKANGILNSANNILPTIPWDEISMELVPKEGGIKFRYKFDKNIGFDIPFDNSLIDQLSVEDRPFAERLLIAQGVADTLPAYMTHERKNAFALAVARRYGLVANLESLGAVSKAVGDAVSSPTMSIESSRYFVSRARIKNQGDISLPKQLGKQVNRILQTNDFKGYVKSKNEIVGNRFMLFWNGKDYFISDEDLAKMIVSLAEKNWYVARLFIWRLINITPEEISQDVDGRPELVEAVDRINRIMDYFKIQGEYDIEVYLIDKITESLPWFRVYFGKLDSRKEHRANILEKRRGNELILRLLFNHDNLEIGLIDPSYVKAMLGDLYEINPDTANALFDDMERTLSQAMVAQPNAVMKSQPAKASRAMSSMSDKKILVVDNDQELRQKICDSLRSKGVLPMEAKSAEEALNLIEKERPDLVLTDWALPGMTGDELALELMNRLNFPENRIIMMTGAGHFQIAHLENDIKERTGKEIEIIDKEEAGPENILKWILNTIEEHLDKAMNTRGGIDLSRANMRMNVTKEGAGVQMQFDQAIIARIKRQGFDGIEFEIETIIPVTNLPMLLGLRKEEQEGHLQLAGV